MSRESRATGYVDKRREGQVRRVIRAAPTRKVTVEWDVDIFEAIVALTAQHKASFAAVARKLVRIGLKQVEQGLGT